MGGKDAWEGNWELLLLLLYWDPSMGWTEANIVLNSFCISLINIYA